MSKVKQLLFDCDNTLVLSENIAFEACADLTNEILAEQHIPDRYTSEQLIIEFVGQNFRGMMASLQAKYNFKMTAANVEHYVKQEETSVIAKLRRKGQPCDGSIEVLTKLHHDKKYDLAIASSSALTRIRASLETTGQAKFFPDQNIYSATTSLDKPTTKPNPAVYLHALTQLGVKPEECITVEDSKSGAVAAVRANIPCIAYVGAYHTKAKQNQVASTLLTLGCKTVMYHWSEFFDCVAKLEQS